MVGFPGETEEEFQSSLDFVKKVNFADAHVFAYSNRKGTKADVMENQVDKSTKENRSRKMSGCVKTLQKNYMNEFSGKKEKILVEREIADGIFEGHMTNYIKVHVKSDEDISKKIISVKIEKCEKDYLVAKIN